MRSFRFIDQKAGRVVASLALLLATVLPTLTPALAGAAQLTSRSVELSSSVSSATSAYTIGFTTSTAARAVAVQFCSNTPLIGEDCDVPAGLSLASANVQSINSGSNDSLPTVVSSMGPVIVVGNDAWNTPGAVSFEITGVVNPSSAGPLYARIITYAGADMATAVASATDDYDASDNDGIGGVGTVGADSAIVKDSGAVAISITDGIGVTGDVLETMTFCVSGNPEGTTDIEPGCTGTLAAPALEIGEENGNVIALDSGALSTVGVLTQISTNALGGAVVSLKSSTTGCGGLSRLGAASFAAGCGITAAGTTVGAAIGAAKIGVRGATATDETANGAVASGDYAVTAPYNTTDYFLNFDSDGEDEGVTSPYGDPFLATTGPASNKEMTVTFGASISPSTPAGRYSASYSLIATGTF